METKTTRRELNKTPADAPLICCSVRENINSMDLQNKRNTLDNPMFSFHLGSGKNSQKRGGISARVFVLGLDGKPLTPCKQSKARKSFKIKNSAIPPTDKSVGILASNIRL